LIWFTLTEKLDEKGLSNFYGKIYEGTRDEEEEERLAEAADLAELAKALNKQGKEEAEED
jgi:hypothetical protein